MNENFYSFRRNIPSKLPFRIRLSDGLTRTDPSTFTDEEIADAGYVLSQEKPLINENTQVCVWDMDTVSWVIRDLTQEELNINYEISCIERWNAIRYTRDIIMKDFEWRISRYYSESRLGLATTDNIEVLDKYMQELRDVTKCDDPFNIVWPVDPFNTTQSDIPQV